MVENNCIVDIVHHFAVMVDYHHVLALFINFRSFDKVWGMYVDDNQKSIVADIIERYLRLDKRRFKSLF